MIVVSDTSPLTALLTVGEVDLLARLFRDVIIPEAVRNELLKSHTSLFDYGIERNRAKKYRRIIIANYLLALALCLVPHSPAPTLSKMCCLRLVYIRLRHRRPAFGGLLHNSQSDAGAFVIFAERN